MRAYRTYVVVEDSGQVTLSDMPFQAGERVEVVVIADEPVPGTTLTTLLHLLKTPQALPQARQLTDAEIAAEVRGRQDQPVTVVMDTNVLVSSALKNRTPELVLRRIVARLGREWVALLSSQ